MKIEKQVCTLEQAKELFELQIDAVPFFMWHIGGVTGEWIIIDTQHSNITSEDFSAFTSAELGMMLLVEDDDHFTSTAYNEHLGEWQTFVCKRPEDEDATDFDNLYIGEGDTEAEAKADALIWMLKNNITNKENILDSLQG